MQAICNQTTKLLTSLGALLFCTVALADIQNFPNQAPFLPIKAVTIDPPIAFKNPKIPLRLSTDLTLKDAILIALRHNTNLQTSINNRQLQNFDLLTAKQHFEPQFTLQNSLTYSKSDGGVGAQTTTRSLSVGPQVSWNFPLGTSVTAGLQYIPTDQRGASAYKSYQTGYNITVTQPLLQGFGIKTNEVALDNAYDQQIIDDLQLRQTVQKTITDTANTFYAVVAARQAYVIAKDSLKTAKVTLRNRKAKLQAGQIPQIDVTQAALNLITQQQSVQTAEEAYSTAKAALLNILGLPANTEFKIDIKLIYDHEQPVLANAIMKALKSNITMKEAELNATVAQRNILTSDDQQKWKLDLVLSRSRSKTNTNYSDIDSPNTDTLTNDSSVALNLTVPLDRVTLDKNKLSAAISLQNDQLTEAQSKRSVVNDVVAAVQNLDNQWVQLQVTKQKLALTQATAKAASIQYEYGKLDAFSLNQQRNNVQTAEQGLVDAKIAYIKQIMAYQTLVGTLLSHWNIHVKVQKHG